VETSTSEDAPHANMTKYIGASFALLCAGWLVQGCGHIGLDSSQLSDGESDVDRFNGEKPEEDDASSAGGSSSEEDLIGQGGETALGSGGAATMGSGGSGGSANECPEGQVLTADGCHTEAACTDQEEEGPSGDCYHFTEGPLNQEAARASCQERGESWDLADVDSEEEYQFILDHLLEDSWIGATYQEDTDSWVWLRGGETFSRGDGTSSGFGTWGRGGFSRGADELCLGIFSEADLWIWDDVSCELELGAVCRGTKATPEP
jgi:hypothetical protein